MPLPVQFEDPIPVEGDYLRGLRSIESDSLRRAWLDGDFHALTGTYFSSFRATKKVGEPDHAWHVYGSDPSLPNYERVESWWHTWMSLDWGYIHPTVFQYHRKSPAGRIYTVREVAASRVEPFEMGYILANDCREILQGLENKTITVYMSPDSWSKEHGEMTEASQMQDGINKEFGPESCFLMSLEDHEKLMKPEDAYASMLTRRMDQKRTRIILAPANNNRVVGWMHMQSLLRFKPLDTESMPDMDLAEQLFQKHGLVASNNYLNQPEFHRSKEVLPRWRIHDSCTLLKKFMLAAMHKPGTNDVLKFHATESSMGDDPGDCARYGLFSEHKQESGKPPIDMRVAERMKAYDGEGYSGFSKLMAMQRIRDQEMGLKKKQTEYTGFNRLAVRRAMLKDKLMDQVRSRIN